MRTCDLLGCCLTTRVTVDVLLQPDMLLIGLSCVVLRHGLADMERSQVTPVTFVLDTSTAQSRLTEYVLTQGTCSAQVARVC